MDPPYMRGRRETGFSIQLPDRKVPDKERLARFLRQAIVLLIIVVVAISVALLALHVSYVKRLHRVEVPEHCTSEACVQAATELMRSVDHRVDPCQNFYRFACGKWGEQVQPTQDPSYHSWFHVITRGLKQSVNDILEVPRGSPDPLAVVNMRKLYESCMNTEALESRGLAPLRRFMRLMGLLEETPTPDNAWKFRLGRTLGLLVRHLGLGPLFSFTVAVDLHDKVTSYSPTAIKIQLSPPRGSEVADGLVSSAEVDAATLPLTADEKLKLKVSFISAVIRHYSGGNTTVENATVLATKILLFRRALQQAVRRSPLTGSSDREHSTFSDVQKTMNVSGSSENTIDFKEFLEVVVQGLNVTVDFEQTDILVTRPTYLSSLAEMLGMFQAESIQRYIWWSVLESLLPYGDSTFVQMLQTYMQAQFDDDVKTRRTACSDHVAKLLPAAVVFAMAQRDPMRDALSRVKEMMEDIQSSFRALVESGEWLDERTKRATLEKADMVRLRIGYPSWNLDSQQLDEYHGQVELHPEEFLDNVLLVKANEQKRKLLELHKNATDDDSEVWTIVSPVEVNAHYSPLLNGVLIRPGILHPPFYGRGLEVLNYAAIGSVLGHELTHGFDDNGMQFNKHGKLDAWWSDKMVDKFNRQADCYVKQYNRYRLRAKIQVNGLRTLGENIADHGGLRQAFLAYRKYVARHGTEPRLVGLANYTHDQLFFLAYANLWCGTSTLTMDKLLHERDTHSPKPFRVIGTLSNMGEFSEAWGCPRDSPMNPSRKCVLW